jgi:hypothetical protein
MIYFLRYNCRFIYLLSYNSEKEIFVIWPDNNVQRKISSLLIYDIRKATSMHRPIESVCVITSGISKIMEDN